MKIFFASLFSFLAVASFAQTNKPYDMVVNGVKVIVVPSGNDIVNIQLVIKGGVQNYTDDQAGIEQMAMTALTECGTKNDTKNSFKNKLDEVEANIYGYAAKDDAYISLDCIKQDMQVAWPLFVDAITVPAFDSKEFTRMKDNAINDLKQQESNPDMALRKMAMQIAFKGKDYAKSSGGTIANLQKFTPQATKAYYNSILSKSRIFMVVVGDFDKAELEKMLTPLLAKIPEGKPVVLKRDTYKPIANTFVARPKELATNYVMGISGGPASNTPEYYPAQLASGLFYDKAFLEVRTNHGLSYAPSAYITSGLTPYSVMYVTTKEPDKYIAVARNMVDSIKKNGFPADDVNNMKNTYATYQYSDNETNASLASMVSTAEVQQGDWRKAFTLKEDLKPVTPADVNRVFNKYIGNFTWVYQGDDKKVNPTLFTQPKTPPPLKQEAAPTIMGKVPGN